MKIFFYASPVSTEYDSQIKLVFEYIVSLGFKLIDKEPLRHDIREEIKKSMDGKVTEAYRKGLIKFVDHVKNADICVFEVSFQSLGTGYLIDKALENNKPTIILYYKNKRPHLLSVLDSDKILIHSYDEKNFKQVVKKLIKLAREKRDKRFNFFLSPKLLDYLDKTSKQHGITKSKFLRDLIVSHMRSA
ncbi:hypothetical protein KC726_02865 [Candidatus Woesebacteria bacterium]|nr:hypothetical protein [Candidatus Woesebacteria bacterium]